MPAERYTREKDFYGWAKQMPALKFPAQWEIKIIPPWGGAAVRFVVSKGKHHVSVYADFDDSLGCVGKPYWEIHPDQYGDVSRFYIDEADKLIEAISFSIGKMEADAT